MIPHSALIPTWSEIRSRLRTAFAGQVAERQLLANLLILVCVAVVFVHSPALSARAQFLDDQEYVFKNALVRNPSWRSLGRFFTEVAKPSTVSGYYQPLTMASLVVDRFLGGPQGSVRVYHRTSLCLHVANTALVGVFLYLLFGHPLIVSAVALLFGLHPISVESVCWISERKTVLATFFSLLSLIAYVRFTRGRKARLYLVCIGMYLLALLSKPITVPLPAMMLLMDYWPLNRLQRRSVTEKIPLFAFAAIFAVITYVSQSRTAPVYLPGDYNPLHVPLILGHNIVFYLYKFLWPVSLSAYYEFPSPMSLSHPRVLCGILGTCVLITAVVVSQRWTRAPLTGWLIFFVMILPAMGVVGVTPTIAANRYAYLPSLAFFMVLASLFLRMGQNVAHTSLIHQSVWPVIVILVLASLETIPMRRYLARWQDTVGLHEYMLSIDPFSPGVHANLAVELGNNGKMEPAFEHFRQALMVDPNNYRTHYNFAVILEKVSSMEEEAIHHYEEALKTPSPLLLTSRLNLGNIYLRRGELDQAIAHYRAAIKLDPAFTAGLCNLGKTLVFSGESVEGISYLREAVRTRPGFLLATRDLTWFLATHPSADVRDPNEAIRLGEQLQAMTQGHDAGVLDALAAAYALDGQYKKAVKTGRKAQMLAKQMRNHELADQIQERLRLYQFECPYYEDPKVQLERMVAKWKAAGDRPEAEGLTTDNGQPSTESPLEISDEADAIVAQ